MTGTDTTILIVDDEDDIRLLLRTVIDVANNGLTVVGEAADGREALEAWRRLDGPPEPDVIILDNLMPHLSGLEVAREILTERPDQLIILYSAFLDDEIRAAAAELGLTCVTKEDATTLPSIIWSLRAA